SNASPKEGSSIWMHCNIGNGTEPIHYVWQHQLYNENFTTFAQGSTSFINITDIVRNQTGWYRCAAGNAVNRESSERLWLNVTFGPDVPQIDVAPTSVVQRGYTALENETVSLTCRVQSNPAGHYVWFHNDSEVYSGPQLVITKIHRLHTGDYTCVGQNSYLNTQSRKTITLTVYYPPDGSPICSVQPVLNHTSLKLLCVWPGGLPSPSLHWTGDLIPAGQVNPLGADVLLPSGGLTANSSLFTCHGSHAALKQQMNCSTVTYIPFAEPVCFANVTDDKQFLVLSCSWGGGLPKALLWWKGPGGQGKNGEESSNVLIVRYSTFQFGKAYVCSAKHPLVNQTKTCGLTLVIPLNVTDRGFSALETEPVSLSCQAQSNPASQYIWFYNNSQTLQLAPPPALWKQFRIIRLLVFSAHGLGDSLPRPFAGLVCPSKGLIFCHLHHARYQSNSCNLQIDKLRNLDFNVEVRLEWQVDGTEETGGWTGFHLEHQWVSERPNKRGSSNISQLQIEERIVSQDWYRTIIQDPSSRSHTVRGLTPTVTYQFRITPINHRTIGHPSVARTPAYVTGIAILVS
uniref:Uncharacterized protein n=1 Tax=Poecilia formosa TaxID=48698 RepID=A0A096M9Q3_POEFO